MLCFMMCESNHSTKLLLISIAFELFYCKTKWPVSSNSPALLRLSLQLHAIMAPPRTCKQRSGGYFTIVMVIFTCNVYLYNNMCIIQMMGEPSLSRVLDVFSHQSPVNTSASSERPLGIRRYQQL